MSVIPFDICILHTALDHCIFKDSYYLSPHFQKCLLLKLKRRVERSFSLNKTTFDVSLTS